MTAPEMGEVLFNFTVSEETHKAAMSHLSDIPGIDAEKLRQELIFLTITVVDYLLRSQRVRKIYGDKSDEVLLRYLACFKAETDDHGFSDKFIDLLSDRGNTYNKILENDSPTSPTHAPFNIAEAFAKYCGAENQAFVHLVVMKEFDSILGTVGEFLESHRPL